MSDPRAVTWGGVSHVVSSHGKDTLCGRRLDDAAKSATTPTCKRCVAKHEVAEQRKVEWAKRSEADAEKTRANREGRFVVYRCKVCGAQRQPSSHGVPWCVAGMHPAELEVVEVQGPIFDPPLTAVAS